VPPPAIAPITSSAGSRLGLLNLLKVGAAQLIVLHHLAFYGPMADYAHPAFPDLIDWLSLHARIAVQVFLVVGGFLAAKSLAPSGYARSRHHSLSAIWRRYAKLAPPFLAATLLTAAASAWAGLWMNHDSISAQPTIAQLAAHALLMHGILGAESIAAGAWYVAIDFQLYAVFAVLLWLCARRGARNTQTWLMPLAVLAGVGASLFYFNRDAGWDNWAPYFFGSYGLGILAWWASDPACPPAKAALLRNAILASGLAALMIDFRSRIAVSLFLAYGLSFIGQVRLGCLERSAVLRYLATISYAQFLIHFPVSLMVNAAFVRFLPPEPLVQALGMLTAWMASVAAAAAFHRWIELPLNQLVGGTSATWLPGLLRSFRQG
jgi:peptidoglycan/LPS O-acetylase OafA/YrhL